MEAKINELSKTIHYLINNNQLTLFNIINAPSNYNEGKWSNQTEFINDIIDNHHHIDGIYLSNIDTFHYKLNGNTYFEIYKNKHKSNAKISITESYKLKHRWSHFCNNKQIKINNDNNWKKYKINQYQQNMNIKQKWNFITNALIQRKKIIQDGAVTHMCHKNDIDISNNKNIMNDILEHSEIIKFAKNNILNNKLTKQQKFPGFTTPQTIAHYYGSMAENHVEDIVAASANLLF